MVDHVDQQLKYQIYDHDKISSATSKSMDQPRTSKESFSSSCAVLSIADVDDSHGYFNFVCCTPKKFQRKRLYPVLFCCLFCPVIWVAGYDASHGALHA